MSICCSTDWGVGRHCSWIGSMHNFNFGWVSKTIKEKRKKKDDKNDDNNKIKLKNSRLFTL